MKKICLFLTVVMVLMIFQLPTMAAKAEQPQEGLVANFQFNDNAVNEVTALYNEKQPVTKTELFKDFYFDDPYLIGEAQGLNVSDTNLAVYIYVGGWGWVCKPTLANNITTINQDGTFRCRIITGGSDSSFSKLAVFAVNKDYSPPAILRESELPEDLFKNTIGYKIIESPLPTSPPVKPSPAAPPVDSVFGFCFSPYMDGQSPNNNVILPKSQIIDRMQNIAPYCKWIRTFGTTNGLEYCGEVAHNFNLKAAIGAWLGNNSTANAREIESLINIGKSGQADVLIVGSEVLLRNDLTEDQLVQFIRQVKAAVPGIPVTTSDTYSELISHPKVLNECDMVFGHLYPFWEGYDINSSLNALSEMYNQLKNASGGKEVWISETGWPSGGSPNGSAVPSIENEKSYFRSFVAWARENNINYTYFSAYDENWKRAEPYGVGPCWGIFNSSGEVKDDLITPATPIQLPPMGYLDYPKSGQTTSGKINVHGWFLDGLKVSMVEVLVDGVVVGQANYGTARNDVYKAYPKYDNSNPGYTYSLDTALMTNGTHSIVIRETGGTGIQTTLSPKSFVVSNVAPPMGYLDYPKSGQTTSGKINVHGWFLDGSKVSMVEVLVDGVVVGQANYGTARNDVYKAYPKYDNSNPGYTYSLDTALMTNGTHSIVIRETGSTGIQTTLSPKSFVVSNMAPPMGALDYPKSGQTTSGKINVQGWFLDGSKVSMVEVLVDGAVVGQANYGTARNDVYKAYPKYDNSNPGYTYSLDTALMTNGTHSIVIRETGSTGIQTTLSPKSFVVSNV